MEAAQKLRKSPIGTDGDSDQSRTLKRQVPDSEQLLKDLETATKQEETLKARKRRMLEACGC